jgi:uncharacterized repeat protein (TIGR01451 family)
VAASSFSGGAKAGPPLVQPSGQAARSAADDEPPARLTRGEWTDIRRQVVAAAYHASPVAAPGEEVLRASNRRQRYATTFRREGIELASAASAAAPWRLGVAVTGYGYADDIRPVGRADPRADHDKVEYRRGPVTEWYVNRPAGLEQGFELQEPTPRRGGPIAVAMAVGGGLDVRAENGGASFADGTGAVRIRYTGLKAWDAEGRELASSMEVVDRGIRLVVDARSARFPVTVDPTFIQEAQFFGHGDIDELAGTGFGSAVAIEGNTAAVGAFQEPGPGGPSQGAAYVFVNTGGYWTLQQKLVAADGSAADQLGTSIALSGDTVVAGAPFEDDVLGDKGAAYVFVRSGATWTLQQKLAASDGATGDQFGWRLSISGDTIAAGAPFHDSGGLGDSGAAYVFVRSGATWTEQQILTASDGAAGNKLGSGVSASGESVVIGAALGEGASGDSGAAYVFVRSGTTWTEQQKLTASDGTAGDAFGDAAAITGDTVVVGAPADAVGGQGGAGSAYVFVRSGTTWTEQQKLTASDGTASDALGTSVSVSFDTVVAGAPNDNSFSGSAYVFVRSGTTWTEQQKLLPAGGGAVIFGAAVSVFGDQALVGAPAGGAGVGTGQVFVRGGATWFFQSFLLPPWNNAVDHFGRSVSVSGETVVVGSPLDDRPAGADVGSVYVLFKSGVWGEQAFLHASDGAADDRFGFAVSVDADTLVAGAPLDDPVTMEEGSAYVFVRSGTTWTEQQKLVASDAGPLDWLGSSAAISGDTLVVGAPRANNTGGVAAGAAYVFVRSGTTWTEQQKLTASDGSDLDLFGSSASIDGDTVVVGAPAGGAAGSAYVFVRSGTTWTEQQKLVAPDGATLDAFGSAVSLSGDTAVIGAPNGDGPSANQGSAYVFVRSGTTWAPEQELLAADGVTGGEFGWSLSVSGDNALVGARSGDGPAAQAGAAYAYVRAGTTWTQEQKLVAPDAATGDGFGSAVSLDGNLAAMGAPLDDTTGGADAGSVYIFRRSSLVDLGVTKTDGQATASPGEQITYTIVASNAGPEAILGAIVADAVPAALLGVAWTCSATPGSSCTASGAGNINDPVNLLVGGSATYVLTGTLDPAATGTLVNTATVAPPTGGFDINPSNNSATDTDTIVPSADLSVTKTDTPDPVLPAGPLTYVVTVGNQGPSGATAVTMTDTLPAGVAFVSSVPGPPTCTFAPPALTCNLGSIAAAGSSTVTINTTVTATAGILVNTATASASESDPNASNGTAVASTGVGPRDGELRHGFDEVFDLAALPGPAADEDVFRISQKPHASYEVLVEGTSGDIGGGSGPLLERIGPDGTSVVQGSQAVGAGHSRSLRWANATASIVEGEAIRVRSAGCTTDCGTDDIYRIRVYETTCAVPRFNNSGSQVTVLILHNPTDDPIAGEAYFRNAAGVLVAVHPFSVGPKVPLVVNTAGIPGAAGVSGTITVAHDGRYGELLGKTVALEPATGFSFDSALEYRAR